MNVPMVGLLTFVVLLLVTELIAHALRTFKDPHRNKVRRRLKVLSATAQEDGASGLLRKRMLSEVPVLHRLLSSLPAAKSLDRLLEKANVRHSLGFFILLSLVLALAGFSGSSFVMSNPVLSLAVAVFLGGTPYFFVVLKKDRRMNKMEEQLPNALELIARGLRAGHAFSTAINFAAEEFDDPLGPEFAKILDEVNFGVSVSEALKHLAERVDSADVKYFVVSVIIQRDTGGNLAEVMDRIAFIIRERFKLRGKIRVLSTEGKLTACVLVALPLLVVTVLSFINPTYIKGLWVESRGKMLTVAAAVMMTAGILVIRKMIRIKV
jgi:tight adherence protein B